MLGHVDVEDSAPIQRHHDETEEALERDGGHHEEVASRGLGEVVVQEGLPGLAWIRRSMFDHVLGDHELANRAIKQGEFVHDARCAPQHIVHRHPPNQMDQLPADRWAPGLRAGIPPPVMLEALAVPAHHRVRLNENERAPSPPQHPHHRDPEDPVAVLDVWSLHAALADRELVAEGDALERELRAVLHREPSQVDEIDATVLRPRGAQAAVPLSSGSKYSVSGAMSAWLGHTIVPAS